MKKSLTFLAALALMAVSAAAYAVGINPADVAAQAIPALQDPQMQLGVAAAAAAGAAGIITWVQAGDTLTLTPAADVAEGQGYLFGAALFGVATAAVSNGSAGEFITEGVVTIAKTSATVIAVGDRVFWDATNKCVNKTATAQQQVGVALEAAGNPSATVKIKLGQYLPVAT